MPKRRRVLIVDSSILQAAGRSDHPVSAACRECLEAIRDICHRVVVTPTMWAESKLHLSWFSRTWRHQMAARRKPVKPVDPAPLPINIDKFTESAQSAIEKDRCLLEAALGAERIIVTSDNSLKTALAQRPEGEKLLKSIMWINPVADGVEAIEAL